MQTVNDKRLNCPGCIRPLSRHEFDAHVLSCAFDKVVLKKRLESGGVKPSGPMGVLLETYLEYITFDRSFFDHTWAEDHQEHNTAFHVVPLESHEANEIKRLVAGDASLHRIERVQNKELFLRYREHKESRPGREVRLFHGAPQHVYNLICNEGFDAGHSKSGLHGYGIYLSSTMAYSMCYTGVGGCSLLLCKAWITQSAVVSDNIHVVHDDFAVYPDHVLYYTKRQ